MIAVAPEGPPRRLRWDGESRAVTTSIGPERLGCEWWRDDGAAVRRRFGRAHVTRDYYRVQDDLGRWLWVCRVLETGRWYVQGVW